MFKKLALASTVIAVFSEIAYAEKMEQVVVTGTRTPKIIEDSPVNIDLINQHELQMVSTGTLADALEFIPGMVVKRSPKDGYNIMMQGFDSNRVLVLIDGMPAVTPTGEAADLDQIAASDIERIEIVRGAASVLYGSSAMGGVVNIITKENAGNGLRFNAELGSFNENAIDDEPLAQDYRLSLYRNVNGWQTQTSFQWLDEPGFDFDEQTISQDSGQVEKKFFRAGIKKQFGKIKFQYKPQYFEESKNKVTGPFPGAGDNYYRSDVEQSQHDIGVYSADLWHTQLRINRHTETSGQRTGPRDNKIENIDFDAQKTWVTDNFQVVGGARVYQQSMNQVTQSGSVELDNVDRDALEVFSQIDWFASDSLELVAGFRAQEDSDFGNHNALRLNSLWRPSAAQNIDFQWRASIGEGYRIPNLKERFFIFDHSNLGYIILGSTDLQPETSISITNGFSFSLPIAEHNPLKLELNVHASQAENFIISQRDAAQSAEAGLDVLAYSNVDEVEISGADLSLGQDAKTRWQLSYSYLDARDSITNERLEDRPYHQLKANYWLPLNVPKSEFLFYALYEKDEHSDLDIIDNDYLTVNFRWQWQASKQLRWKIGANNIFDTHREVNFNRVTQFDIKPISSRYLFTSFEFTL